MKTMIARYPGTCKRTGRKIFVGDSILYFGRGHVELAPDPEDRPDPDTDEYHDGAFPPSSAHSLTPNL